jgi:hypothetical protein
MSLNAAALKLLAAKGLSAEDLVALAEALESGVPKSTGAVRQARYRENKKARTVTGGVTNDVTSDVTDPPNDNISNPPSSEANASGGEPPADPLKDLFELGVSILTATGMDAKQARSFIGKLRKGKSDGEVLTALIECRTKAISEPVEWLTKRLQPAKYVSPKGYEYRGSDLEVMREAERRGDNGTYWAAKRALNEKPKAPAKSSTRTRGSAAIGDLIPSGIRA